MGKVNLWKEAVVDALVINHYYKVIHDEDPFLAVSDLISIENEMILDPTISKKAKDLKAEGYREAMKDWRDKQEFYPYD